MKKTIEKVLEGYANRQINLASEAAREELAEAIYREVGNFLQWWGKKPDIRYKASDNAGADDHPLTKWDEGQRYNEWLDKHDKTSESGGV